MVKKLEVLSVQNLSCALSQEERKKPVEIKHMYIDIGVANKEEAEAAGVELGNMITPYSEFETLANDKYLTAKAFDNRYGCALAIDVLNRLKMTVLISTYSLVPQFKKKSVYVVLKSQLILSNQILQ